MKANSSSQSNILINKNIQIKKGGIYCRKDINQGQFIIIIGQKECFTYDNIPNVFKQKMKWLIDTNTIPKDMSEERQIQNDLHHNLILLYLIYLKYNSPSKFIKWYFKRQVNSLVLMNINNVKKLKDIFLQYRVIATRNRVKQIYQFINKNLTQHQLFPYLYNNQSNQLFFNQFLYFFFFIQSRSFLFEDQKKRTILAPLIDMTNHSFDSNVSILSQTFNSKNNYLVMRAIKNIKKDEQITFNYTNSCSIEYLVSYGFTVADNPYDQLKLFIHNEGKILKINYDNLNYNNCFGQKVNKQQFPVSLYKKLKQFFDNEVCTLQIKNENNFQYSRQLYQFLLINFEEQIPKPLQLQNKKGNQKYLYTFWKNKLNIYLWLKDCLTYLYNCLMKKQNKIIINQKFVIAMGNKLSKLQNNA